MKAYNSQGRSMDHAITNTNASIPPNHCFNTIRVSMDSDCHMEDNLNLQKDPFIVEKHRRRISKLSPMMKMLIAEEFR